MNTARSVKYYGALIALAMGAACSGAAIGPSTSAFNYQYIGRTLSVNGRPVTAERLSPTPRSATIVPDQLPHGNKFEYLMGLSVTDIFDYPKSDKQIGQIMSAGGQGCANALYGYGKKFFWIVGGENDITEYKVLKARVKTLSESAGFASSCAMNTSGDLAVGILLANSYGPGGQVVIFKHASGEGNVITTPLKEEFSDAYDDKGNLFADGFDSGGSFELVELPNGSSTFETITTSNTVVFPGSVQWDGTYLTVFDQETNDFYQYKVSGTNATLKGTVSLTGSADCAQTWIAQGLVYCADAGNEDGEVFKYPAGGSIVAVLATTGSYDFPFGVVAAKK